MNGPPLVVYGGMRRWSPQHFRATLQGYFLPASVIGMAGYWGCRPLGAGRHVLLPSVSVTWSCARYSSVVSSIIAVVKMPS